MRVANSLAFKRGVNLLSEKELTMKISEAEAEAVKLYLKELAQTTQSRGSGSDSGGPKKSKLKSQPAKTDSLQTKPSTSTKTPSSSMDTAKTSNVANDSSDLTKGMGFNPLQRTHPLATPVSRASSQAEDS